MQYVLLIAGVAAAFIFGWFLMGKVDRFLEANCRGQELPLLLNGGTLQIGFCNPMAADGISDVLEQYSNLHPDTSVRIFCGSEDEVLKDFSSGRFDVIFLPENGKIPAYMQNHNSMTVSLNYTPVIMRYGGLPIEPIEDGNILQNVLWKGEGASDSVSCFMKCLEHKFPASVQTK